MELKKKVRFGLLICTGLLLIVFVISLFNPFRDNTIKMYKVENYLRIDISEKVEYDEGTKSDKDYLQIKIANISNYDIYNTEIVFGNKSERYTENNHIWFRIIKIAKNDTIVINFYEDTLCSISSKESTNSTATYNISSTPEVPSFNLQKCAKIGHIVVEEDVNPKITRINGTYWTAEKTIFACLTFVSAVSLLALHIYIIKKEEKINEKNI